MTILKEDVITSVGKAPIKKPCVLCGKPTFGRVRVDDKPYLWWLICGKTLNLVPMCEECQKKNIKIRAGGRMLSEKLQLQREDIIKGSGTKSSMSAYNIRMGFGCVFVLSVIKRYV